AQAPLSPAGVPEARENGVCATCPAPLVLALDDAIAPTRLCASFLSTTEVEVRFSEAMDFAAASDPSAYLVVDGVADLVDRVLAQPPVRAARPQAEVGVVEQLARRRRRLVALR